MAEVLLSKDGLPIDDLNALPVKIAGADAAGGAVNTNITGAEALVPHDLQARLVTTAVTHTGVVVPNGTTNVQSSWQPVPDGMTEFINSMSMDSGFANTYTQVQWSEDGTNTLGKSLITTTNATAQTQKTSVNWMAVGGSFYKVEIWNGDATPRTCSANIKFRP